MRNNHASGCNFEEVSVYYYKKSRTIVNQTNINLCMHTAYKIRQYSAYTVKILGLQWSTSSDTFSLTPRNVTVANLVGYQQVKKLQIYSRVNVILVTANKIIIYGNVQ